jgi:hypothetical protein
MAPMSGPQNLISLVERHRRFAYLPLQVERVTWFGKIPGELAKAMRQRNEAPTL